MPLFPPVPVAILVDGRPLASYVRAYVADGRVLAPVAPLLTRLADRVWYEGDTLVIQRGARRVRVRLEKTFPEQFDSAYVAVGPVLRALGASLCWEPKRRRLIVRIPERGGLATPTPFDPRAPSAPPATVFTPAPPVTPRPIWTGSPLPRRTPLPLPPPDRGLRTPGAFMRWRRRVCVRSRPEPSTRHSPSGRECSQSSH